MVVLNVDSLSIFLYTLQWLTCTFVPNFLITDYEKVRNMEVGINLYYQVKIPGISIHSLCTTNSAELVTYIRYGILSKTGILWALHSLLPIWEKRTSYSHHGEHTIIRDEDDLKQSHSSKTQSIHWCQYERGLSPAFSVLPIDPLIDNIPMIICWCEVWVLHLIIESEMNMWSMHYNDYFCLNTTMMSLTGYKTIRRWKLIKQVSPDLRSCYKAINFNSTLIWIFTHPKSG